MNDALKKISGELAAEFRTWLDTAEVKEFVEATKAAGDTGEFEIVITTENLDRYQEVIKLDGWELEHYMKNPVVLWGHNHSQLPIGITTSIETRDGKLVARGKFATHEYAQTVRQLYDMGVLRAASVGFIEKEREGNLITKAELIEWSIVSVPANPYCLSTLVKNAVSIDEMVTKGFIFPGEEKDAEDEPEQSDPEPEAAQAETEPEPQEPTVPQEPETPADEPTVVEEKQVTSKAVEPIIASLKGVLVALEDLAVKDQEPERTDPPEETDEEKALREFSAKRKLLQDASTVLGEVLAEARQAIETKKV